MQNQSIMYINIKTRSKKFTIALTFKATVRNTCSKNSYKTFNLGNRTDYF